MWGNIFEGVVQVSFVIEKLVESIVISIVINFKLICRNYTFTVKITPSVQFRIDYNYTSHFLSVINDNYNM